MNNHESKHSTGSSLTQKELDTISRQAAIDAVCKAGCGSGFCGVECDEVLALRNMPSAQSYDYSDGYADGYKQGRKDAQPERTGEWMEWMEWMEVSHYGAPPTYVYSCSECHLKSFGMHNYCPNCGRRWKKVNRIEV